jgi:Skp family chaperone for outer membrane proteins
LTVSEYTPTQRTLIELRVKFKGVIFQVETKEGMKDAKEAARNLTKLRTALENLRKEIKEPALRRSQAIDSEATYLKGEIEKLEKPIKEQIAAQEEKEKREAEERARIERERVAGIQQKIAAIRSVVDASANDGIDELAASIEDLEGYVITEADGFAEFIAEARTARDETLAKLHAMHASAVAVQAERDALEAQRAAQEAAAAELARQQAELDRQKAEFEAMKRATEAPATVVEQPAAEPVTLSREPMSIAAPVNDEIDELFDRSEHPPRTLEPAPVASRRVSAPAAAPLYVPSLAADSFADPFDESLRPGGIVRVSTAPLYPNQAPAGYWMDGEYWGTTPEGDNNAAAAFADVGALKLVPFWTHTQEVTFTVAMVNGKPRVVPATDADAAMLCSPFEQEEA